MPMSSLMRDKVTLLKKDGRRVENIQASVQRDKIFTVADPDVPLEEGDVFERKLPNGIVERYTILDAGYYEGIGGIPANYQSEVRKETKIDRAVAPGQVVYNLIGSNARVNIHSVDASSNVVGIDAAALFSGLRTAIERGVQGDDLQRKLQEKVSELETTQGTGGFLSRYQEFIALAANHITIIAPFIPALSQMLK
jgi:hypothetical protein